MQIETTTEQELRTTFASAVDLTVGAEEELVLLDPDNLGFAPRGAELLAALEAPHRFKPELPAAALEVVTDVCRDADEVVDQLRAGRRRLLEVADAAGVLVLASGTHPLSVSADPAPGDRNVELTEEYGQAARLGALAFGLHVHVGVTGADRAVALADGLRSYLPVIAALAANAPCLGGRDTGFWSVRPKLAELFPRQGVPPVLSTPAAYAALLDWGRPSGAIPDARHLWWEVRPHPTYGTVEVRVADQPTRVDDSGAVVAVVHALAALLLHRLDRDGELPVHPTIRIQENRWRALRHGLDGSLLDVETGEPSGTRTVVGGLLDELEPFARTHGGSRGSAQARALLRRNGTERQRAVLAERGAHGLTRWLVAETRADLHLVP